MFNSLTGRTPHEDAPPNTCPHRRIRRRLGAVLAVASALALGLTMMTAPQSAQAQTSIQGQWTVVHGGTGLVTINIDDTYTSTCKVNPNYKDAWCPAPAGTLLYGSGYVDFHGDDGLATSYRVSGLVSSPDTITSYFGSRTSSQLVMKRGISFVCTDWSVGKEHPAGRVRRGHQPRLRHRFTRVARLGGLHVPIGRDRTELLPEWSVL